MKISVRPFNIANADDWDTFCLKSFQATLLHTRRFLSYHGENFTDQSLIVEKGDKCIGLFPAALNPNDTTCVVSHPGATYGGMLHQGRLQGAQMIAALEAISQYYAADGRKKLLYKAVPHIYHRVPAQDDLYAMFRLDAKLIRCDVSSAIDLQNRQPVSQRRKRSLKKSLKAEFVINEGSRWLAPLWEVLRVNLASKHGVEPVHTLTEIQLLAERFPDNICCVCGIFEGRVVAGVLLFVTPTAFHAQYITSSEIGYEISALDAIFEYCIEAAQRNGKRWFDFGISNENSGWVLNEGLYGFKSEFGGGGVAHEFFELDF